MNKASFIWNPLRAGSVLRGQSRARRLRGEKLVPDDTGRLRTVQAELRAALADPEGRAAVKGLALEIPTEMERICWNNDE